MTFEKVLWILPRHSQRAGEGALGSDRLTGSFWGFVQLFWFRVPIIYEFVPAGEKAQKQGEDLILAEK